MASTVKKKYCIYCGETLIEKQKFYICPGCYWRTSVAESMQRNLSIADDEEEGRDVKNCFACGNSTMEVISEGKIICSTCSEVFTLRDESSIKRGTSDSVQMNSQVKPSITSSKEKSTAESVEFDPQRNVKIVEHDADLTATKNTRTESSKVPTTENVQPDMGPQTRDSDQKSEL